MKVLILGSNGLVGTSVKSILGKNSNISELICATRNDADLFNFGETKKLIENSKPDIMINAAAKVGGIYANNSKRTEFILENLKINVNILEASIPFPEMYIINLGSSCIYPLEADNPIKEASVMSGRLEPTNSPYAMAKLTAIEIGEAISSQYGHKILNLMPTNLYGPSDNFSENDSHVIPGLIAKMHKAKEQKAEEFKIWGTGKPLREFLYVDDLSRAIEYLIFNKPEESLLNIGSGVEITIYDLAKKIKKVIEYDGQLSFDSTKPDGNPRKLLDSSTINKLGWIPEVNLESGLTLTYEWYLNNL
tara:strand:+ start:587 stop:1504 length:918 start_codon:yes stop_codon:yes gene_type:complete